MNHTGTWALFFQSSHSNSKGGHQVSRFPSMKIITAKDKFVSLASEGQRWLIVSARAHREAFHFSFTSLVNIISVSAVSHYSPMSHIDELIISCIDDAKKKKKKINYITKIKLMLLKSGPIEISHSTGLMPSYNHFKYYFWLIICLLSLPTAHAATFLDCPLKSLEHGDHPLSWVYCNCCETHFHFFFLTALAPVELIKHTSHLKLLLLGSSSGGTL